MRRTFSVLALLCATLSGAQASYELALIYDSSSRSILRYDPIAGMSLGFFGRPYAGIFGNPHLLSLDPTRPGEVLTMDVTGTVRSINYSTGLMKGVWHASTVGIFPSTFRAHSDGTFLRGTINGDYGVYTKDSTSPLVSLQTYAGFTTVDAVRMEDGSFVSLERWNNGSGWSYDLFRRSSDGVFTEQRIEIMSTTAHSRASLLVQQGKLYAVTQNIGSISTAGFMVDPSDGSLGSQFTLGFGLIPDTTGITNLASGHDGSAYFVQTGTGGTRLMNGTVDQNYFSPTYTLPSGVIANSMVVVTAPEPASMLALAGGLAVILRRRRAK